MPLSFSLFTCFISLAILYDTSYRRRRRRRRRRPVAEYAQVYTGHSHPVSLSIITELDNGEESPLSGSGLPCKISSSFVPLFFFFLVFSFVFSYVGYFVDRCVVSVNSHA